MRQRGGGEQRPPSLERKGCNAVGDELSKAVWNRKRSPRLERGGRAERARDLEGEQRVAAGQPCNPNESRPLMRVAEPLLEHCAQIAEAQGPEAHASEAPRPQRALQPERIRRSQRRANRRKHP